MARAFAHNSGASTHSPIFVNDVIPSLPAAPANSVVHVDALPYGTMLAEFEILELVGVGGFGMVYRAYDRSLQRTVAIKEYMPVTLVGRTAGTAVSVRSSIDQASYSKGLKSFVAEAQLLARFDHPSLVKVYRFWEANNTAYMVMRLYQGVTLKQARSEMQHPPPEAWLRKVLWSVLEAVEVLHEHHTLHRDVAPDNIFLQDTGPAVLLDLGSARRALLDSNQRHTAVLKVNYAPIEQYADTVDLCQGPWTDLYSLAALVHGCLCNDPPLPATFRVVRDRMPTMASVSKTVQEHFGQLYSEAFVGAIDHALAVQPGDRPQSVAEFVAEMQLLSPGDLSRFDWRVDLGQASDLPFDELIPGQNLPAPTINMQVDPDAPTQLDHGGARVGRRWTRKSKVGVSAVLLIALGAAAIVLRPWFEAQPTPTPTKSLAKLSEPEELFIEEPVARVTGADKPVTEPVQRQRAKPVVAPVPTPPEPSVSRPPPTSMALATTAVASVAAAPRLQLPSSQVVTPSVAPAVPCADSNFLTRPMCLFQECQKPQYDDLALCIENRRRYAEQRERGPP